jgi:hypothetical protein
MGDVPGRDTDVLPTADAALGQQFNEDRAGVVAIEAQVECLVDPVQREVVGATTVGPVDERTMVTTIRHDAPAEIHRSRH